MGITAYCARLKIAGMIHIVLPCRPKSSVAVSNPCYYASTGVPLFIRGLIELGCKKNEISLNLYGGASSINKTDFFNIGIRNIEAVQHSLNHLSMPHILADVGGCVSRSLYLDVATGAVKISTQPIVI